jgi:hypothetical protein
MFKTGGRLTGRLPGIRVGPSSQTAAGALGQESGAHIDRTEGGQAADAA